MTLRSCVPKPMALSPSAASTANSTRRPSTLVTFARAVTVRPCSVGATWTTSTRDPTAVSLASKYGFIALSAAFSIIMIMTGVASTGGSIASLKRLARCSGPTTIVNVPSAPTGRVRMRRSRPARGTGGLGRASRNDQITHRDLHRLAVLVERRRANLDDALGWPRLRRSDLEHFTFDAELIAGADRLGPAKLVEPRADDAAGGLE